MGILSYHRITRRYSFCKLLRIHAGSGEANVHEYRNALPEEHRSNVAWGFGFDRVRFVDKIEEQIQAAVALSAPAVTITDTFREAIDILWSACIDAVGLGSRCE